jgi:hypothetical protein
MGGATVAANGGATTPVTTGAGGTTTPVTTGAGGTTTPVTTGAGGSTATTGTNPYQPSCTGLTTAAGVAPTKAGLCTTADPQLCFKTCGPESKGFKSETCTGGSYVEQSGCSFLPGVDYSCYKIPATADATCPAAAPQASQACTVATCVVCGGTTGYLDSTGAAKTGYCVCPAPGAAGTSKWTCASSTAWPCPAGQGC